jgi:glycopeptide antibiotics resistance protein
VSAVSVNALLAVLLGGVLAVALLTPVAAVLYRRRGRLGFDSLLLLASSAIYGMALWTYTFLPAPARDDVRCVGRQTVPFASIDDILDRGVGSVGELLANAAFLQVALNVVLFVPFGFFVRRILRRGVIVSALLALGTSLLIESTQGTGVWGFYRCAYRVFDVDDLITNTTGAVLGSLLSALVVSTHVRRRPRPDHVSLGRRWLGMVCDGLVTAALAFAVDVSWRAFHLYGGGDPRHLDGPVEHWLSWGSAGAVQLIVVLLAGRTVGEWAIAVHTRPRSGLATPAARLIKWALGIGAFTALSAWDGPGWVLDAFLILTVLAAWPGRDHPGLANGLAGLDLTQDRPTPRAARKRTSGPETVAESTLEGRQR